MKRRLVIIPFILLAVLLPAVLSARAGEDRLSEEALKELRTRYPVCCPELVAIFTLPDDWLARDSDIFAVVELSGGRDVMTETFPAKVLGIVDVRDGCSLEEEAVNLSIGRLFYNPILALRRGQRLAVFGSLYKTKYSGQSRFGMSTNMSFYLTDEDYVLCLNDHSQMEKYSGLKLKALKKEMRRIAKASGWHSGEAQEAQE